MLRIAALRTIAVVMSLVCAGCATKSNEITAAYVSPVLYEQWTCDQLRMEAARISTRAAELAGAQDKKASNDAVAVGVGAILFWPALFFIKGDGANAAELSRLRGEMEAIEAENTRKRCGLRFNRG